MMDNKIGFYPPQQCHGVLVEMIERPWWWTWGDSELTNDGLLEIARLVEAGKGYPQPLERPAARAQTGSVATPPVG